MLSRMMFVLVVVVGFDFVYRQAKLNLELELIEQLTSTYWSIRLQQFNIGVELLINDAYVVRASWKLVNMD